MRHLKSSTRNIESSQCFHIGAVCWSWSWNWAFFSLIHPNSELQPVHTDTDKTVTMFYCFALDNINYARWLSVYLRDICQLGCTSQCIKPFAIVDLLWSKRVVLSQPWLSTWAVQCDGKRKWRCSRTCQQSRCFETMSDCWATDCSFA